MRTRTRAAVWAAAALIAAPWRAAGATPAGTARAAAADTMRAAPPGRLEGSPTTQVVLLGTGTPNADPDRSGPAVAVVVRGQAYLVDCGPGIVRRAATAARRGIPALEADRLGIVFITHLHSDHTLGLPDLILTPWVLERPTPLAVYGPPGVKAMARHLLEAYAEDIHVRRTGLEPDLGDGWKVDAHEIATGVVYRDSNVVVKAFAVPHANWGRGRALGFRFETPDRVVVISGDTRPSDAVVEACAGCDLLVHEVYSTERFEERPPEWRRYHAGAHTSTTELAAIATRAKPRLLVLYHQLFWGATEDDLVREVKAGYGGRVVSGSDLDVFR
jgi:ribonuclease BN (tRNA processing enzyme)